MKPLGFIMLAMIISVSIFGQKPSRLQDQVAHSKDFQNLPDLQWKFTTQAPIISTPVMVEDMVYVGSLDSTLYALEINTGKLRWKFKTGGEIRSTVCLNGDQLFLYSGDATLYSIHRLTGKVLWTFKTKGGILGDRRYDFADYFQSSPVVSNDRIFFGAGDGRVYALNATNGTFVWSFKTQGIVHTTPGLYKD